MKISAYLPSIIDSSLTFTRKFRPPHPPPPPLPSIIIQKSQTPINGRLHTMKLLYIERYFQEIFCPNCEAT